MQTAKLYHVKSHGVTIDIRGHINDMLTLAEQLRQRNKSCNVQFLVVNDQRTEAQKHPATAAKLPKTTH